MVAPVQVARLGELEAVIERGQRTFVEVGMALLEIRDGHLYQATHRTFEDYCLERWGWSLRRGEQIMQAAEVAGLLDANRGSGLNERQARELLPLQDQPDAMREVWASVIERAEQADEPVTGPVIRSAVRDYIRAQAVESEAALQRAAAWMTEEQRNSYRPELVRQRGEISRLVGDLASLPEPRNFIATHRGLLPPQTVEQARRAHEWLGRFLEAWRVDRGD